MTSQLLLLVEVLAPAPASVSVCVVLHHQSVFGVCEQCNSSNIIIVIVIIVPVINISVNNIYIPGTYCPNQLLQPDIKTFLVIILKCNLVHIVSKCSRKSKNFKVF